MTGAETSETVRPVNECRNICAGHLAHGLTQAVLSNPPVPEPLLAAVSKAERL